MSIEGSDVQVVSQVDKTYYKNYALNMLLLVPHIGVYWSRVNSPIFSKTVDRKILGHMNDFKRCAEPYPDDPRPIDWHDIAERINNMPTKGDERDWLYPVERFNALLRINLPRRK